MRTFAGKRFVWLFLAAMLAFAGLIAILSVKLLAVSADVTP